MKNILDNLTIKTPIRFIYPTVLLFALSIACTKSIAFKTKPYRFDAGGSMSKVGTGDIRLTPKDIYKAGKNFGWLETPEHSFKRWNLRLSRTDFTFDGVAGQNIAFRADLAAGDWWLTLWIEAGTEDSSTISLVVGSESKQPGWHAFRPTAEPRTTIQEIFRLYHTRVTVESDGLIFKLIGGNDSVRLLGFTLTPNPQPTKQLHESMIQRIKAAGRYSSSISLDSIVVDLNSILVNDPGDTFCAYWHEQIRLLALAEHYINLMGWEWATRQTGLNIFSRYHQAVMILDGLLNRSDIETYPLYERALWQRGRLLYWLGEERHGPNEISGARRDLKLLYQRYPDDLLLAMYNASKVDLPDPCDNLKNTSDAPAWSQIQREALCRLRRIAHWWVNERQAPNGEFGGKLGDDVELLRWWTSLILAGDTTAYNGWRLLSDCVWQSPKIHEGYSKAARDVEHASEFIADTAPSMVLYSDDPEYTDRLRYSAGHFEKLWTGKTAAGFRFFRSAWFSSTDVNKEPPKNRDLEYNTRAAKAVRYLAWKTRDHKIIKLLHEWSLAWVNAAMRTDKGKPVGIFPASVRFPDEAINGDEPTWYLANMFWDYYDWEHHVGSMMMDQLLFTYTLTADETLLQPLFAALELVKTYKSADNSGSNNAAIAPGSPRWVATQLQNNKGFWSVISQWRLLTNDSCYDDLIFNYGTSYARYRLSGDEQYLLDGFQPLLESVRYNVPMLTSEVLHTDRVYVRGAEHLKAMLTGDGIPESMSPYYAVSWEQTDDTFTALVIDTGKDQLSLQIFSHADFEYQINIRIWQLEPGTYGLKLQSNGELIQDTNINVEKRGQRILLVLPPKSLLSLNIKRIK